jgi:hypothetical protein
MKGIPVSADSCSLPAAAAVSPSAANALVVARGAVAGTEMPAPHKPAASAEGKCYLVSV